jgi:ABC-2 type transport system ATP-binding protein
MIPHLKRADFRGPRFPNAVTRHGRRNPVRGLRPGPARGAGPAISAAGRAHGLASCGGDIDRTAMKALSIHGLTKTYGTGLQALRGLDLEVDEGDFFALLGPNGAGKTTMIGIITSLVSKTGGTVQVFGHDIDRELEVAKAQIGLVPQEINFNLFDRVENIVVNQAGYYGIPRAEARRRAEHYLGELKLWDKRNDRARNLSGGMKRRLMIARALVHQPRLLILDEPTAGVDIEIRRSMWDFLRKINEEGTTIILTTHYLEEAETLCRNIAIIDDGQIIERDRMSNILRKLHVETFVLNLAEPKAQAACEALAPFGARVVDESTIEIDIFQDQGYCLNDIFAALTARGLRVPSMRNKVNRLEELFLRLVEDRDRQQQTPVPGEGAARAEAAAAGAGGVARSSAAGATTAGTAAAEADR